jgi:nucleotide-binding universal stress UspA family protein
MMPFRRVVVGVDFTDTSLAAARWASVQLAPDAEIVLAHVTPTFVPPPFLRGYLPSVPEADAEQETALYRGLRGFADLVGRSRTRVEMLSGRPPEALAEIAQRVGADVICVGKSAKRRGAARFGATTATRLLARTGLPVVVVPSGARKTPERILAAVGEHAQDDAVLRSAGLLAARWQAKLLALHVVEPSVRDHVHAMVSAVAHADGAPTGGSIDSRLQTLAEQWLASTLPRAGTVDDATASLVRHGDPGQEIITHARQAGADLLVVGCGSSLPTVGGNPACIGAGSTTRLVLWAAECPVLVLGRATVPRAPVIVALDAESRPRSTPFIVGRSGRRTVLVRPRPPRRPGPGGGDAA